jgi:hypothetical protein
LERRYYQSRKAGLQSPVSDPADELLNNFRAEGMTSTTCVTISIFLH